MSERPRWTDKGPPEYSFATPKPRSTAQPDSRVGVIVARFQLPDLHDGHRELLRHVTAMHGRVIVMLGVAPVPCTKRNPLDYATRARMVSERFPEVVVVPLPDQPTDEGWSASLDSLLKTLCPNDEFALYSGRDGFASAYRGRHKVQQFETVTVREGTAERAVASSRPLMTEQERRGAIYAIARRFPVAHAVVDIAVTIENSAGPAVLVGRKAVETAHAGHRFIGGFVEPGESLEEAAARETKEESGLSIDPRAFKFVRSFHIDDWRYRGTGDGITSSLFHVSLPIEVAKRAVAGDDMASLELVRIDELDILDLHKPLLEALKERIACQTGNDSRT